MEQINGSINIIAIFVTILRTAIIYPLAQCKSSNGLYSITLKQDYLP
ncbi:hypothetical protein [Flavobacterium sp. ACAM 123]|nr:hypothetical protein [Flavobacterium sp. ACAM 123]